MNVADSEKLQNVVRGMGYEEAAEAEQADLILINTCVVRQNAEDRAAWYITSAKGLKKENPNLKIGVCGCIVTEPGRDLKKQFPHVDFFIPPNSPGKLAEFLKPSPPGRGGTVERQRVRAEGSTFVNIAHGCDNYCSYCVVPYVRGRETSRPMDEVLAEIKGLMEKGAGDITLLGQNVNSYKYGLANLLKAIGPLVPGTRDQVPVIRFMTSHPKDMTDEIIETVAELPCVAKEFHLPLQSGDNEILKKMNRGYTVEYFKDRIEKIRSLMPDARITTDLMVGFPGETAEQFENSLDLVKTIAFKAVNMFAYSPRPQTAAAKMPDQLPDEVKQARLQKLIGAVRKMLI
ncbi:MAG: tRNA (N6-isopentenyl adenosine(37)-C2)-methylthiotransferase MiaB [Candidatus Margulisbacteria bacterium]|nr:tRNA (N6-isopentenyl adenosine(37)-C2)-methylthiotransferase MiaB [Candidatus Margulisiibacteriota bacterium]